MSKLLADCHAFHVKNFLENNWYDFVDLLSENYDEDAEAFAEKIIKDIT